MSHPDPFHLLVCLHPSPGVPYCLWYLIYVLAVARSSCVSQSFLAFSSDTELRPTTNELACPSVTLPLPCCRPLLAPRLRYRLVKINQPIANPPASCLHLGPLSCLVSLVGLQCIRKVFIVLHFFQILFPLQPYSKIDEINFSPQTSTHNTPQ